MRGRPYLGRVVIARDRFFNSLPRGSDDQTLSYMLGFAELHRERLGQSFAPVVDLTNRMVAGEQHHCLRSLYGQDSTAIWLPSMQANASPKNSYPRCICPSIKAVDGAVLRLNQHPIPLPLPPGGCPATSPK